MPKLGTDPFTNLVEQFGYDLAGNPVYATNFNGVVITNQYDVMNRLTNRASVNGYKVSYTYNPATGQRQTMTDSSGTTSYAYDSRDRLQLKTVAWAGGPSVSLNYRYDANGNLTNLWSSTANGVTNVYQYDPLNRLTNVVGQASSLSQYAYDAVGNLQSMRYGNGVTNQYQYDSLNRLTNLVWKTNGTTIASFSYQLGLTGNRTNVNEFVKDSWRTNQWQYDPLYRLTNETVKAASVDTLAYAYDPVGNRTNRTSSAGFSSLLPSLTNSFTTNDWLKTDAYDNNGNTIWSTNGTVQGPYFYDVENRLTNFKNTIYIAYNGDGVRVRKISGTTTNYYLADDRNPSGYVQVLEEHQALSGQSPALKRVYNYGLDLVSQREAVGTVYYFGYDGHDSTRFLFDASGTAVQKFSYDAYGTLIDSNAVPATVYLYAGEQWDPDLEMYSLRARYFNPNTGRFWTLDTYQGNNEDPLSLHKYLYCQADPVDNVDPSGQSIKDELSKGGQATIKATASLLKTIANGGSAAKVASGILGSVGPTLFTSILHKEFSSVLISWAKKLELVETYKTARTGDQSPRGAMSKNAYGPPSLLMVDFHVDQSALNKGFAPASIVFDVDGINEFLLCYIGWQGLPQDKATILKLYPSMWNGTKMVPDLLHPVGFDGKNRWFGMSISPMYYIKIDEFIGPF